MSREAYLEAVDFFLAAVDQIPQDKWDQHGLGDWTIRDLVGHTNRSLLLVEEYSSARNAMPQPQGYADPAAVAQRGREAGQALGGHPAQTVHQTADRVLPKLQALADNHPMVTPFGALTLTEYLSSRTVELTIHSFDISNALGIEVAPPSKALTETLASLAKRALRQNKGKILALAITGRAQLPPSFSLF